MFHQECITQWFFKKLECPMCRKNFKEDLINSLRDNEGRESDSESHPGDDDVINLNEGINSQIE